MRDIVEKNLSSRIEPKVVKSILDCYQKMVAERRKGGIEECLTQGGKFVEHCLRAVEFIRTGTAPVEIKNASDTIKAIEKDKSLPDSLRVLIPKVAHAMVYEIRSKRGAVHVKEIDPHAIDAALCVQAASWIVAELLRLYHTDDENAVVDTMSSLMRVEMPLIELFGDEMVVTAKVPCPTELLLLIANSAPSGMDRKAIGLASKNSASTISKTLQRLAADRLIHRTADGQLHITGPGEKHLTKALTAIRN